LADKVSLEEKLEETMKGLNKRFGRGTVQSMDTSRAADPIESISSGNALIDSITGIGGFAPRGRIIETYGPESGGKSTLALQVAAQAQKEGGKVLYLDIENALNTEYAAALGVDVDKLIISQPDVGEDALDVMIEMIQSGCISVAILDSVAALAPRAELEGDMSDQQMGLVGRMMGKAMRKLNHAVAFSRTSAIFINQVRDKLGVMFGNPETTPGGRSLKFYASLRVEIRRISQIKKSDVVIGANTKIKIIKNKFAPPYRECEIPLIYGRGFINE
jgi:recombination protein RecA